MINFSTLQGLTIPEGVVTQIEDASGRVLWAVQSDKPVILEVEKITSDTYAGGKTYTAEEFILLDIYPTTNGTVNVTYGGLTKTVTDTSGAEEPNAIQVFFGTFNGVSDEVETPASGELTIEGDYAGVAISLFSQAKSTSTTYDGIIGIKSFGGINEIPYGMCSRCKGLTDLTIPSSVKRMGHTYDLLKSGAFSECTGLTNLVIQKGLTNIGTSAFNGCTGLTSVTIPNSVIEIGSSAFNGCTGLTSVTIPNSVTTICTQAFKDCSSLTSIIIPDSVIGIGTDNLFGLYDMNPFYSNKKCNIILDGENKNYKVDGNCLIFKSTNTVVSGFLDSIIPSYVTQIGYYAFNGCTGLTSVTIPNSVTTICLMAFEGCTSLTSITFENTSGWYVTTTQGGDISTGTPIDVSDPVANATLLTDTYPRYYWYRT